MTRGRALYSIYTDIKDCTFNNTASQEGDDIYHDSDDLSKDTTEYSTTSKSAAVQNDYSQTETP